MKNDSLLQDLETIKYPEEKIENLRQSDIVTYSRFLTLLSANTTESGLRTEMCEMLWSLSRYVDKRRIAGSLVAALHSSEPKVSSAAAHAIGMMGLKRAIPQISEVATDKNQLHQLRRDAILALGMMGDARALSILRTIIADKTDNLGLRADAVERTVDYAEDALVQDYIALLGDSSSDLRFWAAYCLGQNHFQNDITPALAALDQVVAFDHTVPTYWGWHVDREALLPFEDIYFRSMSPDPVDSWPEVWIVSPAEEYENYIQKHRHWTESWIYATDVSPVITFLIEPSRFMVRLQERWKTIALNVRKPRPQAYLVDFQLMFNGQMLIGGLHRDGYTLILTGGPEAVSEFVAWYRGLFAPDLPLFLYEWADFGISLASNITSQDICQLITKHGSS